MGEYAKKTVFIVLAIIVAVVLLLILMKGEEEEVIQEVVVEEVQGPEVLVVGNSVEGRKIESYTFGSGDTDILLVGGIHGGYEWNSVLLAYEFIDHYTTDPLAIPENITLTIIPSANPDGLFDVVQKEGRFTLADVVNEDISTGRGRFNTNDVDLNRNFACKWQPESTWRGNVVSAGTEAFSEPEARAIRSVVDSTDPEAVVFFHSQAGAVYASECEDGILPVTRQIMDTYATAAGYRAIDVFDSYEVTGDAEGWLASIGIPAITVELETHETVEWAKNLKGVEAVLRYFGE